MAALVLEGLRQLLSLTGHLLLKDLQPVLGRLGLAGLQVPLLTQRVTLVPQAGHVLGQAGAPGFLLISGVFDQLLGGSQISDEALGGCFLGDHGVLQVDSLAEGDMVNRGWDNVLVVEDHGFVVAAAVER